MEAVKSGDHVIEDGGRDFVDAYILKIQKDENSGAPSTFKWASFIFWIFI